MNNRTHGIQSLLRTFALVMCAGVVLAGCKSGGGGDDSGTGSPTPSGSSAPPTSTPTPSTSPSPSPAANSAPRISGTTISTARVNAQYSFTPAATDADGDTLSFQIQNKPAWATFNTTNGRLTGTPGVAHVGAHANIIISASDGKASSSLTPFSISVTQTTATSSAATLSWTAPTTNTDGSVLTNLSGFTILYGRSSTALNETVQINNPSVDQYMVEQLTAGTYYFAIKARSASGAESALSAIVSKVIS